jgi:O-antigen/teichoic acid export membrane protein
MTEIRRAFLWASVGRYLVMTVNLAAAAVMARLLTPDEYGISVLGGAVFAVAEAIRALGGGAYLIQKRELTSDDVRSSFTVSLAVTIVLTVALVLLSGPLTRYFVTPDLGRYIEAATLGFLTGPFVYPISALMSRQLAFGTIALIGVVTATINAAASIWLASLGFSFMSFAWASAISAIAGMLLYLYAWNDSSIFRTRVRGCRSVIAFGAYDSATAVLYQVAETLPYFIFGRLLNVEAVGLCQRAVTLSLFPERVILAGVGAVALPALARQVRESGSLRQGYFRAIELITAALWPALILLALLASPVVTVLLGRQWQEVAPLVEILALALLFSFPASLHYPVMVAAGSIRYMPPVVVLQSVVSLGILIVAARQGLRAAAFSMLLIVPLNSLLSLLLVRFVVGFHWIDLAYAVRNSAACAALSAVGPVIVALATRRLPDMPLAMAALATLLAACGWFGGLWLTRHPLLDEVIGLAAAARARLAVVRLDLVVARLRGD